ncbi:hypothetical protein NPIL_258651 [Nephila pilipes]|uniref:Uncharacterized protein n=1 Tax=Nephila pilipes TaxID=299642 RepID=A0A8X6NRR5_NEPPI|nr:hypothetical protein NPIL_258651 [Nephila pilipes]
MRRGSFGKKKYFKVWQTFPGQNLYFVYRVNNVTCQDPIAPPSCVYQTQKNIFFSSTVMFMVSREKTNISTFEKDKKNAHFSTRLSSFFLSSPHFIRLTDAKQSSQLDITSKKKNDGTGDLFC